MSPSSSMPPAKRSSSANCRAGKIEKLEVTPKSRKKDIVILDPMLPPPLVDLKEFIERAGSGKERK